MDQLRDLHARGCTQNAFIDCGFMLSVSLSYLCYVLNVVFLFFFVVNDMCYLSSIRHCFMFFQAY